MSVPYLLIIYIGLPILQIAVEVAVMIWGANHWEANTIVIVLLTVTCFSMVLLSIPQYMICVLPEALGVFFLVRAYWDTLPEFITSRQGKR